MGWFCRRYVQQCPGNDDQLAHDWAACWSVGLSLYWKCDTHTGVRHYPIDGIPVVEKYPPFESDVNMLTLLGIFAASLALTWHSHQHLSLILLPFILYLLPRFPLLQKTYKDWLLIPPIVNLLALFIAVFMVLKFIPFISAFGSFLTSTAALCVNLLWLAQSINIHNKYCQPGCSNINETTN